MMSRNIKITILADNNAFDGLATEHGFSLWIEAGGKHILFDTGQTDTMTVNARALGVDLRHTDILVLSHGHYDHTGGIPQVLALAPNAEIYRHPGVTQIRYSIRNGLPKPIHMQRESMIALQRICSQKLHDVSMPLMLTDNIGLTGPIPRETTFEDTGGPFYLDPEGVHPDPIDDDIALWIRTESGLIVCVGCCHAGLVNTLNLVQRLNHGQRIRAIIGGFHLSSASQDRMDQTVAELRRIESDAVIPCHCTGDKAVAILQKGLGEGVTPGAAGMILTF